MWRKLFFNSKEQGTRRKDEKEGGRTPTYPPPRNALRLVPPEELLESQKRLVHDFEYAISLTTEETDDLIRPVLLRFAETVQLLPASEFHHHSDPGGFFYHSLEVGLNTVLKLKHHFVLDADKPPPRRKFLESRWQACYAFSGLLHDVGRVMADLMVIGDDGSVWNPMLQSLYQWGKTREIEYYYPVWIRNRIGQHERFAACFLHLLLPEKTLRWLSLSWTEDPITQMPIKVDPFNIDPDDQNLEPVNAAFVTFCSFLAGNECKILSELVRESDWESVRKDLKRRGMDPNYPKPNIEQEFNINRKSLEEPVKNEDKLNMTSKPAGAGKSIDPSSLKSSSTKNDARESCKDSGEDKLNIDSNSSTKAEEKAIEASGNGSKHPGKVNISSNKKDGKTGKDIHIQHELNENAKDQGKISVGNSKFNKNSKRIVPEDTPAGRMIRALARAAADHPEWVRLDERLLEHPEMAKAAGISPGECVRILFEAKYIEPDPNNMLRKVTIQDGKTWLKLAKGLVWLFEEAGKEGKASESSNLQQMQSKDQPDKGDLNPALFIEAREKLGNISQGELAQRLGISRTMVSMIEIGKRPIPPEIIKKLHELVGE